MTLEAVANQLFLPILVDTYPNNIKLSAEEEAIKAELKKGISGNAKVFHWVGAFSKVLSPSAVLPSLHSSSISSFLARILTML